MAAPDPHAHLAHPFTLLLLLSAVGVLAVIVTIGRQTVRDHLAADRAETVMAGIPLLGRLSLDKRGPYVLLNVKGHCVRIRTNKGEAASLVRRADAIRERVGVILTISLGEEIPVCGSKVAAIKEAGPLSR